MGPGKCFSHSSVKGPHFHWYHQVLNVWQKPWLVVRTPPVLTLEGLSFICLSLLSAAAGLLSSSFAPSLLFQLQIQNSSQFHLWGCGLETWKAGVPAACHLPDPISRDRDLILMGGLLRWPET